MNEAGIRKKSTIEWSDGKRGERERERIDSAGGGRRDRRDGQEAEASTSHRGKQLFAHAAPRMLLTSDHALGRAVRLNRQATSLTVIFFRRMEFKFRPSSLDQAGLRLRLERLMVSVREDSPWPSRSQEFVPSWLCF